MELNPADPIPSSKIDHVGITAPTEHFESLIEFYLKALAPLNYKEIMRVPGAVGPGDQAPDFWISETKSGSPQGLHFAFAADDRKTVDAFHEAALVAGGKCNGKPGLRTEYHPNYYAAFIIDPRGNNVEIVCHLPVEE
ncbi:Glyoxalase/Bleomycin resistance protein/Dihydroxybiphenyl dioxygenase [Aspergillus falconensis]